MQWDNLWINTHLFTADVSTPVIKHAALAIKDNRIAWLGPMDDLSAAPETLATQVHDLRGHWLTPGFIDCHTHLVYAGNRAMEFNLRLQGKTYAEIAEAGGGIVSTMKAVRAASEDELYEASVPRLQRLCSEGVTTIEIKSGYGLEFTAERAMLRVAKRLEDNFPVRIVKTFLGAHCLPPDYKTKADAYLDLVCHEWLPQLHAEGLVDMVDVFCETIAFNLEQTERVLKAAQALGLPLRMHTDQLNNLGGCQLAAKYGALAVDHLEFANDADIRALAQANTVSVLLPGAFYFLRETQKPPVDLLRKHNVPIAIATDCNPGSSPVTSLLLMINMACVFFGLTPEEALFGVTINAAKALGIDDECGSLTVGKRADIAAWDIQSPEELAYNVGLNPRVVTD